MSDLEALRKLLNGINVTNDMISNGVRLSRDGLRKVAARFSVSVEQVQKMLDDLSKETRDDPLYEEHLRYTYESDFLGNITIRDTQTGDVKNLTGSDAFGLLSEIERLGDYQSLLSGYFTLKESADEELDGDIDDEITGRAGTYNFPMKGFLVTVRFWVQQGKFKTKVISIRDAEGEEYPVDDATRKLADETALQWVGRV